MWYKSQCRCFFPALLPVFISVKLEQRFLHSARTAYLPHDASILIILKVRSFYTQFRICYSLGIHSTFPHDIKDQREFLERHGAKSNHRSRSGWLLSLGACALLRNTLKKIGILPKNHNMTSFFPRFPGPALPQRKRKCVFSEVFFHNNIHTINRSGKYIFQILQSDARVCIQAFLFDSVEVPGAPEGLAGLQCGAMCGCQKTGVFAVSRASSWKSLWNKIVVVWQFSGSFAVTVWAFVITTKEHTSRVSP